MEKKIKKVKNTNKKLNMSGIMEDKFKLLKPFGDYKKGQIFDSFGGLIRGICCRKTNKKINFDNKEYFKLV